MSEREEGIDVTHLSTKPNFTDSEQASVLLTTKQQKDEKVDEKYCSPCVVKVPFIDLETETSHPKSPNPIESIKRKENSKEEPSFLSREESGMFN